MLLELDDELELLELLEDLLLLDVATLEELELLEELEELAGVVLVGAELLLPPPPQAVSANPKIPTMKCWRILLMISPSDAVMVICVIDYIGSI